MSAEEASKENPPNESKETQNEKSEICFRAFSLISKSSLICFSLLSSLLK